MRIVVAAVGRMKSGPERELVARYLGRAEAAGRALGLSGFEVLEALESRAGNPRTRKADEAKALSASLPAGSVVVALDARGSSIDSETFAHTLGRWRDDGRVAAGVLIGGADGLDAGLLASADLALNLSSLTWPHQLVRIMLAEQLYRATTILSGHPYHRGD